VSEQRANRHRKKKAPKHSEYSPPRLQSPQHDPLSMAMEKAAILMKECNHLKRKMISFPQISIRLLRESSMILFHAPGQEYVRWEWQGAVHDGNGHRKKK